MKASVQAAKRRFYCEKIDSSSSCRQRFAVSSELLGKSSTATFPSDIPRFVTFSPTRLTVSVMTWTRAHVSHRPLPLLMVHGSLSANR